MLINIMASCKNVNDEYRELSDEVTKALEKGYADEMLLVSKKITEDYFSQEDGVRFLKLKVTTLLLVGKYPEAVELIGEYSDVFENDCELIVARGIIENWLGNDGDMYFYNAFRILSDIAMEEKKESEKVLEYYLSLLLNMEGTKYIQEELYSSLTEEEKTVVKYYRGISKDERILSPPIGFIVSMILPYSTDMETESWW